MYAVVVTFEIHPQHMQAFLPLMKKNAEMSLAEEHGCHRFDVCTDPDRPNEVFLYELYTNRAGFEAHLKTAHFQEFDAAVADMIAEKTVRTYATVMS